jgi:hypothetical protein
LKTENPNYGFYGVFRLHDDPDAAWALAMEAIAKKTGCPAKVVRRFLDSTKGRLFAEGVSKLMSENALSTAAAVDAAVEKLMDLSLPYLKVVCDCELEADTGEGWPPYTNTFV